MTEVCNLCRRVTFPDVIENCENSCCPHKEQPPMQTTSDGSTASYYELPEDAKELQDLISYKDMNGQMAEIFRACYRYGEDHHSDPIRDLKKILFYAQAEIDRVEKYEKSN